MKANFKNIKVEVEFGVFKELDITKGLGNYLHANTSDIGLDEVARNIYHSDGEIDISDEYVADIVAMVSHKQCALLAAIKKAIINELKTA